MSKETIKMIKYMKRHEFKKEVRWYNNSKSSINENEIVTSLKLEINYLTSKRINM